MGREMRTQTKASLTTFIDISDHISGRFQHGYIMVRELGSGEPLNCWAKLGVDPGTAKRACRGRTGASKMRDAELPSRRGEVDPALKRGACKPC